jgi:thioredoxin-related protein
VIRLLIVVSTAILAMGVGTFVKRRGESSPTQVGHLYPTQIDRTDFDDAREWLAVAFTSATCNTCADVENKLRVLESRNVGVRIVEYGEHRDLHRKYAIDSVPCAVFADSLGVVHAGFVGPVSATDLWAALARIRDGVRFEQCSTDADWTQAN